MFQRCMEFIIVRLTTLEIITTALCIIFSIYLFLTPSALAQIQQIQLLERTITIVFGASDPAHGTFYDPQSATINTGTVVTWVNNDNSFHTVTFVTPGIFDSGIISPSGTSGNSRSHTFFNPGVFNYFCRIHPFMTGGIVVS